MSKYRYYIVPEYEDPKGTNDREVALAAAENCTVIDTETGKEFLSNDPDATEDILEADRDDYIDDDSGSDDEGEDE